MRNEQVIMAFLERRPLLSNTGNLFSTGDRLFSYTTCIAEFDEVGRLYINLTKYSKASSKHTHMLTKHLMFPPYGFIYEADRQIQHIIPNLQDKINKEINFYINHHEEKKEMYNC